MSARRLRSWVWGWGLTVLLGMPATVLWAEEETGLSGRIRVGLTYASGITEVGDEIENHLESRPGVEVDRFEWPVGLTLSGGPEYSFGNAIGALGLELRFGPPIISITDLPEEDDWDADDGSDVSVAVLLPIGGGLRYTFLPESNVSPYVRVGLCYIVVAGDDKFIEDGAVGFDGAVGVEFLRTKRVGVGVEVGYNSAEVKVANRDVEAVGFNASVYASFKF
jgi:hypothetical protein